MLRFNPSFFDPKFSLDVFHFVIPASIVYVLVALANGQDGNTRPQVAHLFARVAGRSFLTVKYDETTEEKNRDIWANKYNLH